MKQFRDKTFGSDANISVSPHGLDTGQIKNGISDNQNEIRMGLNVE